MKTILIIILMNLANPQEPATLIHKSFNSPAACQLAYRTVTEKAPPSEGIKISGFCVQAKDLLDEELI